MIGDPILEPDEIVDAVDEDARIDAELDAVRVARPGAYRLALVLSPAVHVARSLLRRARLMLGDVDPSAEADLWASHLLSSQTSQGFVIDMRVADRLRARLALEPELMREACDLIASEHAGAPWPVRAEEALQRLSMTGAADDLDRAEQVLLATARRMVESTSPSTVGQWIMRTLVRLPPALASLSVARAIQVGAGARIDGTLDVESGQMPADAMENWLPWLLTAFDRHIDVTVRFGDGFVELEAEPGSATTGTVSLPDTTPLIVDLRWHDGLSLHVERVALEHGTPLRVEARTMEVEVRALDGARYRVRKSGVGESLGTFNFGAIRARHLPLFGREELLHSIETSDAPIVAITGAPGIGKTALLCGVIQRLERRGRHVAMHFLDDGPKSWASADAIERSLLSQLLPDPSTRNLPGLNTLADALWQSSGVSEFWIAIDGLDVERRATFIETIGSRGWPQWVRLIYTSSTFYPLVSEDDSSRTLHIDLHASAESNDEVCRMCLDTHRATVAKANRDPHKVFISYVRGDAEAATRATMALHAILGRAPLEVSHSETDLEPGASWQEWLDRQVSDADLCVLIASEASAASDFVRRECQTMLNLKKPIVPLMLDRSALSQDAFKPLKGRQFIDQSVAGWEGKFAAAVERALGTPSVSSVLLQRANGNIGRLLSMLAWIKAQPQIPVPLTHMPPTLFDGFEDAWKVANLEGFESVGRRVLGYVAAAREPLRFTVVAAALSLRFDAIRAVVPYLENAGLLSQQDAAQGEDGDLALSDDSIREPVLARISEEDRRHYDELLALNSDENYRLRYRVWHLMQAGDTRQATTEVLHEGYLAQVCATLGVDEVERQLTLVLKGFQLEAAP